MSEETKTAEKPSRRGAREGWREKIKLRARFPRRTRNTQETEERKRERKSSFPETPSTPHRAGAVYPRLPSASNRAWVGDPHAAGPREADRSASEVAAAADGTVAEMAADAGDT